MKVQAGLGWGGFREKMICSLAGRMGKKSIHFVWSTPSAFRGINYENSEGVRSEVCLPPLLRGVTRSCFGDLPAEGSGHSQASSPIGQMG